MVEVDVLPAQRDQFALPEAGHRGGQEQDAVRLTEFVPRRVRDHAGELVHGEEADVGVRLWGTRAVDILDRIPLARPRFLA